MIAFRVAFNKGPAVALNDVDCPGSAFKTQSSTFCGEASPELNTTKDVHSITGALRAVGYGFPEQVNRFDRVALAELGMPAYLFGLAKAAPDALAGKQYLHANWGIYF